MQDAMMWAGWLWDQRDEIQAALMGIATALGALVLSAHTAIGVLRGLVKGAEALADRTASKADDRALATVTRVLDAVAHGLSVAEAVIPRAKVTMGSRPVPASERRSSRPPQD